MTTTLRTLAGARLIETGAQDLTGLLNGTAVMTLDGEMPVEHLAPGDRIITRDTGMAILRAVRMAEAEIAPIEIKAGSLGHSRPDRDAAVAPGTRIHVRDWRAGAMYGKSSVNVAARRLADGEFIAEGTKRRVRVYDLFFERQHILYADGLEVASAEV